MGHSLHTLKEEFRQVLNGTATLKENVACDSYILQNVCNANINAIEELKNGWTEEKKKVLSSKKKNMRKTLLLHFRQVSFSPKVQQVAKSLGTFSFIVTF